MTEAMSQVVALLRQRRLLEARGLLRALCEHGDVEAAEVEVALTANGTGAHRDWPEAVALLRRGAARFGGVMADQLALIDGMNLTQSGDPQIRPTAQVISKSPRIERFRNFLTPDECVHIARQASPLLEPSHIIDPISGIARPDSIRTSSTAVIGPSRETLPIQAILRRLAIATGTGTEQGESLTVLHYAPGQEYRLHSDLLPRTTNQRIATALIYLNDAFDGGETRFPFLDLTVRPRAGDALFFEYGKDGYTTGGTRHTGLPVKSGSKWVATRWIRKRAFNVWEGPEAH